MTVWKAAECNFWPAVERLVDVRFGSFATNAFCAGAEQCPLRPRSSRRPAVQRKPGMMEWPTAEIDRTVLPTDAQRASLEALQNASAKAADMLKSSCAAGDALTPPGRLAAVGKRLDTMLDAVKTVRSALNDFYASLSDEQKARFEAIGPSRTSRRS